MALVFRREGQRPPAQHEMARRRALGRQQEGRAAGRCPRFRQGDDAFSAGNETDPKPFAPQGQGRFRLDILHDAEGGGGAGGVNQYLTPRINKMLFHITK